MNTDNYQAVWYIYISVCILLVHDLLQTIHAYYEMNTDNYQAARASLGIISASHCGKEFRIY